MKAILALLFSFVCFTIACDITISHRECWLCLQKMETYTQNKNAFICP